MAKVIFARSPFIIEIKELNQTSTRLVLEIYSSGGVLQNTYTFSKAIPSSIDYGTYYNISNFISEYLSNINPDYTTSLESTNLFCKAIVKRYKTIATVETLIDTTNYLCVDGFTEYLNGMNSFLNTDIIPLTSDLVLNELDKTIYNYNKISQSIKYNSFIDYSADNAIITVDSTLININPDKGLNLYINVFIEKVGSNNYSVKYNNGVLTSTIDITPIDTNPIIKKIYLQPTFWSSVIPYTIELYKENTLLWSRVIETNDECKYTPSLCSFISKSGGWENVYFMKAKETSSTMDNTNYSLMRDYNYNIYEGSKKSFNTNGNDFIKLNTGYVDESMNIILKDLLFSETILLDDKPVLIKNKAITYKNTLKEKLINYEIEFEYAFDYLNNVV